ncbi:hypothetical protein MtrunA17_Chr8g0364121 [Medicago truncatula]|uniref:Uncharacterized protein n=2 Tax=Medicago truncatula TaxID=3880 RepID=A0A396GNV8_MEDTR|nr:hypothetical protein MtrunA17_Chr8g0364121 [Medicago truncatula]
MFDIGPKELANSTQVVHSKLLVDLENKLQTETLSSNLTTPVQCSKAGKLIGSFAASDSASHALDPTLDLHSLSAEHIGEPGMTDKGSNNPVNVPLIGHTVLVKDPQFTILRSKNTVPLKPPDPCSTRKLQHSDNISVADNQALIITSAKTVGCKATPEKTDCIATSVSVSAIFAGDPNLSKQATSSKIATYDATIITPITTYDENLGPDKGRISQPANSKNTSEACKKSEKLLSKFWAGGLDSDHAPDEETDMSDEQEQNLERDIEEGSLFTPFMSRRQKKNKKKKHPNKLNDTGVQHTFSEHIQTRSKKCVIKSNPKYL